jgi:hypothetical protein
MDILVLAETQPKDSYNEVGLQFYKQYAIGYHLTDEEKDNFYKNYRMQEIYGYLSPVITLRRRVDNRDGNLSFWEWDYFDVCESQEKASNSFGDSDYWFNSNSVNPLHTQAVEKNNRQNELQKELNSLEDLIIPAKFQPISNLKKQYQDQFTSELKSRKLYSKAQKGKAPQDVIDEMNERIGKAYREELSKVEKRIEEIKEELKSL